MKYRGEFYISVLGISGGIFKGGAGGNPAKLPNASEGAYMLTVRIWYNLLYQNLTRHYTRFIMPGVEPCRIWYEVF